ncbi:MAG: hypothetical protein ACTHLE_04175 [Agriterribacter sp.]
MKKLIIILFACSFGFGTAKAAEYDTLDNQIKIRYLTSEGVYRWALAHYPSWWLSQPTRKAKAMIFLHGTGEAGTGEAGLVDLSVNSVPYFFKNGSMPSTHTNPKTGATEEFLYVSLQTGTGGLTADQLHYAIFNSPNLSRIDRNNVTIIALSLGARVTSRLFADSKTSLLADIRSIILMSSPNANDDETYTLTQPGGLTSQAKPLYQIWSLSDNTGGTVAAWNNQIMDAMQTYSPTTHAIKNYSGGHCCWNTVSSPSNRQNVTFPWGTANVNVFEWTLAWSVDENSGKPPMKPITTKQAGAPIKFVITQP